MSNRNRWTAFTKNPGVLEETGRMQTVSSITVLRMARISVVTQS